MRRAATAPPPTGTGAGTGAGTPAAPREQQLPPLTSQTLKRAAGASLERWARRVSDAAAELTSDKNVWVSLASSLVSEWRAPLSVAWRADAELPAEAERGWLAPALSVLAYAVEVAAGGPATVQVWWWILSTYAGGTLLVFLLFHLLGSRNTLPFTSYVIGLSLVPLVVLEPLMTALETPLPGVVLAVKAAGVVWAARAASTFLVTSDTRAKVFLFMYPVLLLHVYMLNLRR